MCINYNTCVKTKLSQMCHNITKMISFRCDVCLPWLPLLGRGCHDVDAVAGIPGVGSQ